MNFSKMASVMIIGLAVSFIASDAAAKLPESTILNCFHPEGAILVGGDGFCIQEKDLGGGASICIKYQGTINYKGVITKNDYQLTFEFEIMQRPRDGLILCRYTPVSDSSPISPDSGCRLRNWHVCGS